MVREWNTRQMIQDLEEIRDMVEVDGSNWVMKSGDDPVWVLDQVIKFLTEFEEG